MGMKKEKKETKLEMWSFRLL